MNGQCPQTRVGTAGKRQALNGQQRAQPVACPFETDAMSTRCPHTAFVLHGTVCGQQVGKHLPTHACAPGQPAQMSVSAYLLVSGHLPTDAQTWCICVVFIMTTSSPHTARSPGAQGYGCTDTESGTNARLVPTSTTINSVCQ